MKRIIDANLNRATEALRVIEEIARFSLDNADFAREIKHIRHEVSVAIDQNYAELLKSRDTEGDVGTFIKSTTERLELENVFKANFKRVQQALRVLAEYGQALGMETEVFEQARYKSYTLEKKMFEELSEKIKIKKLETKKLYLVTDRTKFASDDDFLDAVGASLKGGVQILQLREKTACAKEFLELAKKVKNLCAIYDTLFIINDRVDIAKIVAADGVHLGQDDIDICYAREIIGKDAIIGLSTHSIEQGMASLTSGADYIGVGPVFETPTKPGRKSVGLDYVTWASQNVNIPWFAIGGIDLGNVSEVINAGASRVAVVRAIINDKKPAEAAENFIKSLNSKEILK